MGPNMKMHLSEANFFIKKIHLSEPNPDLWDCQSHSDDLDGSFNQRSLKVAYKE